MDDKVIKVEGVSKNFRLPHEKNTTIKSAFVNAFKGKRNKTISTQHALRDISFEVKKGEFFGIVGRNGSGKSTLLKILAGIYQPTRGNIYVQGKLVPFIELGVGFNPELTGRENIFLNGALLGFSKEEIDAFYDEVVQFAELDKFMDQKLKNYSSGMQVRLAFSMAIQAEADVLLIDEVLAVGDADFQRKCFEYFKQLKKNKKTVVFVSHDMNAVREYCDRAILIEKSKVIASGMADKIATQYTRMFLKVNEDTKQQTSSSKRWGNNKVVYKDIKVDVSKEKISILLEATANESLENPNFGFMIRDGGGQILLGTNSQIKKKRIKEIKRGDKLKIIWEFQNIFNDGQYYVEPAIVGQNGEVCDWWEDSKKFTVRKEERTSFAVNPPIELRLETK